MTEKREGRYQQEVFAGSDMVGNYISGGGLGWRPMTGLSNFEEVPSVADVYGPDLSSLWDALRSDGMLTIEIDACACPGHGRLC